MQYLGGKYRLRKKIGKIINGLRDGRDYYEPFVGGGWIIQEIEDVKGATRFGSDLCLPLITMWQELQKGWEPQPRFVDRDLWKKLKETKDPKDPMTAYAGFGFSSFGKFFSSYFFMKNKKKDSIYNSLMRQKPKLENVQFSHCDYNSINPFNSIIYCDPPYENTAWYNAVGGNFDSEKFYRKCREWSKNGNIVLISEYSMPDDFELIASWDLSVRTTSFTDSTKKEGKLIRKNENLYAIGDYDKTKLKELLKEINEKK